MRTTSTSQLLLSVSKGLCMTLTDLALYTFYICGASFFKSPASRGIYQMFQEADEAFAQFNSRTIINSINRLKKMQYITTNGEKTASPVFLSREGKDYLRGKVPFYRENRPWDGQFFITSFDIPESKRKKRDTLRAGLKRAGAGLLHKSIWLSPYDPISYIGEHIKKFLLDDWIVIFKVSRDSIRPFTQETLNILVERIYDFKTLNQRYGSFIDAYKRKSYLQAHLDFSDIVKDDPQLPFELEPPSFLGRRAYNLLKELAI